MSTINGTMLYPHAQCASFACAPLMGRSEDNGLALAFWLTSITGKKCCNRVAWSTTRNKNDVDWGKNRDSHTMHRPNRTMVPLSAAPLSAAPLSAAQHKCHTHRVALGCKIASDILNHQTSSL